MICIPMEIIIALVLSILVVFGWSLSTSLLTKINHNRSHHVMVQPSDMYKSDQKTGKNAAVCDSEEIRSKNT